MSFLFFKSSISFIFVFIFASRLVVLFWQAVISDWHFSAIQNLDRILLVYFHLPNLLVCSAIFFDWSSLDFDLFAANVFDDMHNSGERTKQNVIMLIIIQIKNFNQPSCFAVFFVFSAVSLSTLSSFLLVVTSASHFSIEIRK